MSDRIKIPCWILVCIVLAAFAPLRTQAQPADRDRFGGWANGPSLTATGYFHTVIYRGRRWLVDPDGHLYFAVAMGRVNVPSGPQAGEAITRVKSWRFNAVSLSHDNNGLPYMAYRAILSGQYGAPVFNGIYTGSGTGPMPDVYDPKWQSALDYYLAPLCSQSKNDPRLIGYYVDNELGWLGVTSRTDTLARVVVQQSDTPVKRHFAARLQAKYHEISAFNAAWHTSFSDWDAVRAKFNTRLPLPTEAHNDCAALLKDYANVYFSSVAHVLHANDVHHLYLGCRFSHWSPEIVAAAAHWCDVVSFDYYGKSLKSPSANKVNGVVNMTTEAAVLSAVPKPVIISEFGSTLDDPAFRQSAPVFASNTDRASHYNAYLASSLACSNVVGVTWYEYSDDRHEPNQSRALNQNARWGFVDEGDQAYGPLTVSAAVANGKIYAIRGAGMAKPAGRVPKKPRPPRHVRHH